MMNCATGPLRAARVCMRVTNASRRTPRGNIHLLRGSTSLRGAALVARLTAPKGGLVSRAKGDSLATNFGVRGGTLERVVLDNLSSRQGRYPQIATRHDWYMALAYTVRD